MRLCAGSDGLVWLSLVYSLWHVMRMAIIPGSLVPRDVYVDGRFLNTLRYKNHTPVLLSGNYSLLGLDSGTTYSGLPSPIVPATYL